MIRRLFALLLVLAVLGAGPAVAERFRFAERNGVYEDLAPTLVPIVRGPLTIELTTTSQSLRLIDHVVVLEPLDGDLHAFGLTVELEGSGDVDARVEVAGSVSRLQDRVTVPRQSLYLNGTARLHASDEEGWVMSLVERPDTVSLDLGSRLADGLGGWCEKTLILPLLGVGCDGLGSLLSRVAIPLPEPGVEFRLERSQLTEVERRTLDDYLRRATAAGKAE